MVGVVLAKVKRWFDGSNKDTESNEKPSSWLVEAASNSPDWESPMLIEKDGLYWYFRAAETAPEYDTPILSEEQKAEIRHDVISCYRNSFVREYQINDDVCVRTESPEDENVLNVKILIDDFDKWASTSRLYQGYNGKNLGLGGKFYADLSNEVREALSRPHVFFDCEEKASVFSTSVRPSPHTLEKMLDL